MPLHWTIQSELKLATIVAEGDVVRSDIEAYLSVVVDANISAWRKLIDARTARLALTNEDVNSLGARLRAADAVRTIGPLAFVVPAVETPELRRLLGFLAAAKRPMRIFEEFEPARKWILQTKLSP